MKMGDLLAHLPSLGLLAIGTLYLTFVGRDSTCISAMTRGQFRIRGQTQSMSDFGYIGRTVAYWVELVLLGFKAHCAIVESSHLTNPVCSFGKHLPHQVVALVYNDPLLGAQRPRRTSSLLFVGRGVAHTVFTSVVQEMPNLSARRAVVEPAISDNRTTTKFSKMVNVQH